MEPSRRTATIVIVIAIVAVPFVRFASAAGDAALEPVEPDVHEFMEYAFEPFFKQLRQAVATEPSDRKAWVPIKANSLVLAENGNLLMLRSPTKDADDWKQLSAELREQGKTLYAAAKKRQYPETRKAFENFVLKCNACHDQFAEGEHQQKAWD